jgi:hypothetical protein
MYNERKSNVLEKKKFFLRKNLKECIFAEA